MPDGNDYDEHDYGIEMKRPERTGRRPRDRYQHYDTAQGYGSRAEWAAAAEALAASLGLKRKPTGVYATLGLDGLPASRADLRKAFRKCAFAAHPDRGGSNEAMREVVEAYETIKRQNGWS